MIPFVNLSAQYKAYKEEIDSAVVSILESGNLIGGAEVQKFEENLTKDTGVSFAISCASGTSALCLALAALGLKPGLYFYSHSRRGRFTRRNPPLCRHRLRFFDFSPFCRRAHIP